MKSNISLDEEETKMLISTPREINSYMGHSILYSLRSKSVQIFFNSESEPCELDSNIIWRISPVLRTKLKKYMNPAEPSISCPCTKDEFIELIHLLSYNQRPSIEILSQFATDNIIKLCDIWMVRTPDEWKVKTKELNKLLYGVQQKFCGAISDIGKVCCIDYSPDGNHLASSCINQTIKILDTNTGRTIQNLRSRTHSVNSVCYSPDGNQIASGCSDRTIKIWDAKTGNELNSFLGHYFVNSVCYSPDGNQIASGCSDRTITVWDTNTGRAIQNIRGHTHSVSSVCYSPDGNQIASGGGDDQTVKIWDAKTGDIVKVMDWPFGYKGNVNSVCYSPDGNQLVSANSNTTIMVWDIKTGHVIQNLRSHTHGVNSVCYSPDGNQIASGGDDQTVKIWDAKTGNELNTLSDHKTRVNCVRYSPDGIGFASSSCKIVLCNATLFG